VNLVPISAPSGGERFNQSAFEQGNILRDRRYISKPSLHQAQIESYLPLFT